MEWQDQGISSDIEDRRAGGGGGGFGFGGGMGIGGFILLLILSVVTGRNFFSSEGGSANVDQGPPTSNGPVQQSPGEERDLHLISFVLDDTQKTWSQIFAEHGRNTAAQSWCSTATLLIPAAGRRRPPRGRSIVLRTRRSISISRSGMN